MSRRPRWGEVAVPAALVVGLLVLAGWAWPRLVDEVAWGPDPAGARIVAGRWTLLLAPAVAALGGGLTVRWSRRVVSRPAAMSWVGLAHALAWLAAGYELAVLAWNLPHDGTIWGRLADALPADAASTGVLTAVFAFVCGGLSAALVTRDRPAVAPTLPRTPVAIPAGRRVTWTGSSRLGVDAALFSVLLPALFLVPPSLLGATVWWAAAWLVLAVLVLLRHSWVTVTVAANGIRIRTGPLGRRLHLPWAEVAGIAAVTADGFPDLTVRWSGISPRVWLRAGPALRIARPGRPDFVVTVDDAPGAVEIAATHLTRDDAAAASKSHASPQEGTGTMIDETHDAPPPAARQQGLLFDRPVRRDWLFVLCLLLGIAAMVSQLRIAADMGLVGVIWLAEAFVTAWVPSALILGLVRRSLRS